MQIVLVPPEGYEVTSSVASSVQTTRKILDTPPAVQTAIETLKAAVLTWEQEDREAETPA